VSVALAIRDAGPSCTIQDQGRLGWLRFGVTPSGPMDWISHRRANGLAGNDPASAAIEIGPGGLACEARGGAIRLGISADGFIIHRDGKLLPSRLAITLLPGETVSIRPGRTHVWGYIAVQGGFTLDMVMGSLSTHMRSGIGPLGGRALSGGTSLPVRALARSIDLPDLALREVWPDIGEELRFVRGPQADHFPETAMERFQTDVYRISARSDRMGYRLDGDPIAHSKGHDIVSDGIALGAIQVPGDGLPIVLMADRQPTGGYPKIGTVIRADLPMLAQMRAGAGVRFRAVAVAEAVRALGRALAHNDAECEAIRPL
jgi:5-oxoprolinase (ATP-hydrolysing) subunit C